MRIRTTWCITLFALCHPLAHAAGLTNQLLQKNTDPAQTNRQSAQQSSPQPAADPAPSGDTPLTPAPDPAFGQIPVETAPPPATPTPLPPAPNAVADAGVEAEATADTGVATPIPPPPTGSPVEIRANRQGEKGGVYTLDGDILILYNGYQVRADHAVYDKATGEARARGHLQIDGGPSDEHLLADRGVMNLSRHTGDFFNVRGTLGVRKATHAKYVFTAPNPFTITGREVLQSGPGHYRVLDGTLTSCRVPDPDWQLLANSIAVDDDVAHTRGTTFTLFHLPVFWLPYATHPVEQQHRQSGILLPIFGNDTTKGLILGESVYLVLGRSADATLGSEYFSRRGYSPFGQLRYRGAGKDFASLRFHALLDRLPGTLNQGGVDIAADARRDLSPQTHAVADVEYLSSYVYRQAFEENFSAAINSEVNSITYLTHENNGVVESGMFSRYQNFRSDAIGDEIKVLQTPGIHFEAYDQPLGKLPLLWGGEASAATLSRSEPGFQTSNLVPRLDLYPHLALPLHADGWNLNAEAGVRDTFYDKSQQPGLPGDVPMQELGATLNRTAFTSEIALHPPALERDFTAPAMGSWLHGAQLRHTIEPELTYRYVTGVNHYADTLRFDTTDALTDTNELEYGLTQHLFLRHTHPHPCKGVEALGPQDTCGGGTVDWLTWTVAQRHYFNPTFGGAVVRHERNVFDDTLDLTGVAFLNNPRANSPVISRLRLQTTGATDVEWDLDYDVDRGRLQASNLFAAYRAGNYFFSFGDARLVNLLPAVTVLPNAPTPNPNSTSSLTNFNQFHAAAVYGSPTKHGLSAGANIGYDLTLDQTQYLGVQAGYNRDCCGLALEMRRYSLGIVRDDTQYLFSFTLAGVGSAGSLRPMLRVF